MHRIRAYRKIRRGWFPIHRKFSSRLLQSSHFAQTSHFSRLTALCRKLCPIYWLWFFSLGTILKCALWPPLLYPYQLTSIDKLSRMRMRRSAMPSSPRPRRGAPPTGRSLGIDHKRVIQCRQLFYLSFQCIEFRCIKKLAEGDFQSIAELFDIYDPRIFAFGIQHAIDCHGRNTRKIRKGIDCKPSFLAQFNDSIGNSLLCIHSPRFLYSMHLSEGLNVNPSR